MTPKVETIAIDVVVESASRCAVRRGARCFSVGGAVRDLLAAKSIGDFDLDIILEGDGLGFARDLASELGATVKEFPDFLTAKITGPFHSASGHTADASAGGAPRSSFCIGEVDVATARREEYLSDGALPRVTAGRIEEDLQRRDFTINAMALPLSTYGRAIVDPSAAATIGADLLDPFDGRRDFSEGIVRILHPKSFRDDPTRLFRAVRYRSRLSFTFDEDTAAAFDAAVADGMVKRISTKRVWNEIVTALDEPRPWDVIAEFSSRGLFEAHLFVAAEEERARALFMQLEKVHDYGAVSAKIRRDACVIVLVADSIRRGEEGLVTQTQIGRRAVAAAAWVANLSNAVSPASIQPAQWIARAVVSGDAEALAAARDLSREVQS